MPLGPVDTIEDPRLVRIGNYEDGVSGRHDAPRVLEPFLDALLDRAARMQRMAVLLHDAGSLNKVAQTLLEMVRGGIERAAGRGHGVLPERGPLDPAFAARAAVRGPRPLPTATARSSSGLRRGEFDYVVLFESSGMYRGEDIVGAGVASDGRPARRGVGQPAAVGARHPRVATACATSKTPLLGAVSYVGSHVLSLAYLLLYGRYISDTLSAVRAVRPTDALGRDRR